MKPLVGEGRGGYGGGNSSTHGCGTEETSPLCSVNHPHLFTCTSTDGNTSEITLSCSYAPLVQPVLVPPQEVRAEDGDAQAEEDDAWRACVCVWEVWEVWVSAQLPTSFPPASTHLPSPPGMPSTTPNEHQAVANRHAHAQLLTSHMQHPTSFPPASPQLASPPGMPSTTISTRW